MRTLVLRAGPKGLEKGLLSFTAKVLREGGLVAFPTETVYGLGANALNRKAIDRLYKVKKRPKAKPFTIHIADLGPIKKLKCAMPRKAKVLINKFWPGPLTIILRSNNGKKIGFRMPDNMIALRLIRESGVPVAAPSANISGNKPPATARAVLNELDGKVDIVIDGGRTRVGVESTVLDLTVDPPVVLREGAIKTSEIFRVYGQH